MAGTVTSVVGKQVFTMNFASGSSQPYVVLGARFFPLVNAAAGVLLVRVASMASAPSGAQWQVSVTNVLSLSDDPGTLYIPGSGTTGGLVTQVSIGVNDSLGTGRLYQSGWSSAVSGSVAPGYMAAVTLTANYSAATAPGQRTITMAVDLLTRDAS